MTMATYRVKRGDSLWSIAKQVYGSGGEWHRIWKFNNRPSVIRKTGRGIPNPDLIFVGQELIIPMPPKPAILPRGGSAQPNGGMCMPAMELPVGGRPPPPNAIMGGPLSRELPSIAAPVGVALPFNIVKASSADLGVVVVTTSLTGKLLFTSKNALPITYVLGKQEIEASFETAVRGSMLEIFNKSTFKYNPATRELTVTSAVTSKGKYGHPPSITGKLETNGGFPVLKFEFKTETIKGQLTRTNYVAADVTWSIEFRAKAPTIDWRTVAIGGLLAATIVVPILIPVDEFLIGGSVAAGLSEINLLGMAGRLIPAVQTSLRLPVALRFAY